MELEVVAVLAALWGVAVVAGTFGALAGLGGGIIIVPVLSLFFKVNVHYAIGASVVSVIATSSGAAATYIKANITNVKVGLFLSMATTVGALSGAYLGAYLAGPILFIVFGLVLGLSAAVMWQKRKQEFAATAKPDKWSQQLQLGSHYYDSAISKDIKYEVQGTRPALGLMYIAGLVSGLLGIGSGALKVPAMDLAMKLPIKVSSATSNFMIGITAAASAGVYLARGYIDPFLSAPVALGVLTGSVIGTRLLIKLKGQIIRELFIGVLVVLALQMIFKAFGVGF